MASGPNLLLGVPERARQALEGGRPRIPTVRPDEGAGREGRHSGRELQALPAYALDYREGDVRTDRRAGPGAASAHDDRDTEALQPRRPGEPQVGGTEGRL